MTSSEVGRRYAQALLELAAEQGQLEPWGAEFERLAELSRVARSAAPGGDDAAG